MNGAVRPMAEWFWQTEGSQWQWWLDGRRVRWPRVQYFFVPFADRDEFMDGWFECFGPLENCCQRAVMLIICGSAMNWSVLNAKFDST